MSISNVLYIYSEGCVQTLKSASCRIARTDRLSERALKLTQETATSSRFRGGWRTTNVNRSTIEAETTFSAPRDLSTLDDHDDVDRAPDDGRGALFRNAPSYLVADIGGGRPEILSSIRSLHYFAARRIRSVLFCFTWALIHHLLGGLRHFAWDIGRGFDLRSANLMARATLIGSVILTILVWAVGIWMRGAL